MVVVMDIIWFIVIAASLAGKIFGGNIVISLAADNMVGGLNETSFRVKDPILIS